VLTSTIVATNSGPGAASNVVVTDTPAGPVDVLSADPSQGSCTTALPITCTLGPLAAGARATVTIRVRPTAPGPIDNGAIALTPSTGDINVADATAQSPNPSVRIVKRALRHVVAPGQTVPFVVRVTSVGNSTAQDLRVCDRLPASLTYEQLGAARLRNGRACWTISSLAPGRSRTFRLSARAREVSSTTRATNVVTVTGSNVRARSARASVTIAAGASFTG
jgi:uncharacterized repeat protein (TIGR01451 family)